MTTPHAFTDGERQVVADYLRVDPKTVEFVELLLAAKVSGVFTGAMAEATRAGVWGNPVGNDGEEVRG
jgi:hypothetical protein